MSIDDGDDMEKQSKSFDLSDEKRLTVREKDMGQGMGINLSMVVDKGMDMGPGVGAHHFNDGLSAVAEEDEVMSRSSVVGLARTADMQVTTPSHTGDSRAIEYKKL